MAVTLKSDRKYLLGSLTDQGLPLYDGRAIYLFKYLFISYIYYAFFENDSEYNNLNAAYKIYDKLYCVLLAVCIMFL